MKKEMSELRDEIARLDRALLELLESRFQLAARVGHLKAEQGQPVVVPDVEQQVLTRAREAAALCQTSPEVMESIFAAIMRGSVERQHRVGVELRARGGANVLILGAAGAMGGWLRRFLEGMGHTVEGADATWTDSRPSEGRHSGLDAIPDLNVFDAIFVSVPLDVTGKVLTVLASRRPSTPVFEIASIKSHLREPLDTLRGEGTPVLSLHPMFGPGKNPYEPLTVVHAVGRDEQAERAIILGLLAHPYLDLVSMPFAHHDRVMGWLLGLAHLTGLLFADALSRSGLDPAELGHVASTTFRRQVATAHSVLMEDPDLYFAIQRLNPHRGEVYAALTAALGELTGAVERDDASAFTDVVTHAAAVLPKPARGDVG